MERISRFRAHILLLFFGLVIVFFAFKLYDLQIIETEGKTDNTTTFTTLTRVKAARGDILDSNGNVLVSNRASYDLVLNHYVVLSASNTNEHLYRLTQLCEELGIQYNEHFPISHERPFSYTLDECSATWQSYFQTYLTYMGDLDSDITAPLLIEKLRERYNIPAEWTDDEARLVIGLRYELSLRSCISSLANYVFLSDASDEALSGIVELNIPGMNVEASTVREYNTSYAAHILGYVGSMSPEQWEYYQNIEGYEMDAEIGQTGLEAAYEEYLHGVDGWREDTVNADGTLVSSQYIQEPKAGANVEVSLNMELQMAAEEQLEQTILELRSQEDEDADGKDAEGGAVVAMDVKTGQVLVSASYPTYDLTTFFDDYTDLAADTYKPLFNRALDGAYPPGSTYKVSMVVAAFQDNILDSTRTIYDAGIFTKYAGFSPTCLGYNGHGSVHGTVDTVKALQVSCNYFFYQLGDEIRLSAMDSTAKALGLGEPTGIELPEETGHRANKQTKADLYAGTHDSDWFIADQILAAIGQSDNRFTPMQLCVYASTLANQGVRYRATFMNRVVSADYQSLLAENKPEVLSELPITDECYNTYTEGMLQCSRSGTAAQILMHYPIDVAGKTGTAEHNPSKSDHGAFICYAPADDPQIAIAVYVENGGHGTSVVNVAKAIMDVYFDVEEVGDVSTYENRLS